jgi:hypothetical protein
MKTLRKTAEEAYLKYANKIINRETWIDGFISGIQYKKEYPQSIELCGLLWDTEDLAIGGYEKDGRPYYTWREAMDAAKSVGKRLPTKAEWKALCDLGSTWDDERKGRWFGGNHNSDHKGSLFLPAAGLLERQRRVGQHELQRLLLVLVAVLRRQQQRGQPLLLLGQRLPAGQQLSRLRLQRALCTKQIIYMKIFKCHLPSGKHILIYRSGNKSSDYFQYVEEYTKKDIELPIFNEDTLFDTMQGKRTEDKILIENGIESIQDLSECYCQIRNKVSNLSKKVRDLVIKKYSDIINNYNFDK